MRRQADAWRLFGCYALASAIPVVALGFALSRMYQAQMETRALDQAASEAAAIADAGIRPILGDRALSAGISAEQRPLLMATTEPLLESGTVLRLRLRDLSDVVVFDAADPTVQPYGSPDDEAAEAAAGETTRKVTRMNADEVDSASAVGVRAVEAYLPLHGSGPDGPVIGVLEIYLPYAPIAEAFTSSSHAMIALIAAGLTALWLALGAITYSVMRRLRRSAAQNEYLALHDALTGLPNRRLFHDRVRHAVAAAGRSGATVCVAVVDLNRFKAINDALGHHNGDRYLRHIGAVIGSVLRPGDTVARLAGNEFGVLLTSSPADALAVVDRFCDAFADDVDLDGIPVSSEASVGLACWPDDSTDVEQLLHCADLAMYAAKQTHSAVVRYSVELAPFSPARLALVSELRHAIDADELVLHYQPKLNLRTAEVTSVEALIRWQHPTRGLLAPIEFLEIAESTGLIDPLTDWVLRHAVEQIVTWRRSGIELAVAVNISARNLRNERLPDSIIELLQFHDLPAGSLEIELTETALLAEPERARAILQRLHDHGVRVSLDDFGQGYTSLAQLGTLPLTELKIDRAFVSDMLRNAKDHTIVTTLIDLAHNLDLHVTAEGAEQTDAVTELAGLGCDNAQGYALSAPLPAADLEQWLQTAKRYARSAGMTDAGR